MMSVAVIAMISVIAMTVITMVIMSTIAVPFRAAAAVPSVIPMAPVVVMPIPNITVFYMAVLYRVITLNIHCSARSKIVVRPVAVIAYGNVVQTTNIVSGINTR